MAVGFTGLCFGWAWLGEGRSPHCSPRNHGSGRRTKLTHSSTDTCPHTLTHTHTGMFTLTHSHTLTLTQSLIHSLHIQHIFTECLRGFRLSSRHWLVVQRVHKAVIWMMKSLRGWERERKRGRPVGQRHATWTFRPIFLLSQWNIRPHPPQRRAFC